MGLRHPLQAVWWYLRGQVLCGKYYAASIMPPFTESNFVCPMCVCVYTGNPVWDDIFESSFKAQCSKLECLFSLKHGKKDVRALSFELWALKQHSKMFEWDRPKWDRLYMYIVWMNVCMCMCMCVCMYMYIVWMNVCMRMCICMYMFIILAHVDWTRLRMPYMCVCAPMHICMYVHAFICVCVYTVAQVDWIQLRMCCICIRVSVCMYICMYVCVSGGNDLSL